MIFVISEHKHNKFKSITSELLVFAQRVGRAGRHAERDEKREAKDARRRRGGMLGGHRNS